MDKLPDKNSRELRSTPSSITKSWASHTTSLDLSFLVCDVRILSLINLDIAKVSSRSKNMILNIKNVATTIIIHLGKNPTKCMRKSKGKF